MNNVQFLCTIFVTYILQGEGQLLLPKNLTGITKKVKPLKDKPRYTPAEWAKLLKSLQPSLDLPIPQNATIKQPEESGKLGVTTHIIGGKVSTRGQFPWQAMVMVESVYTCGGSLISPFHVLTAAHCTQPFSYFLILMGVQNKYMFEHGRVTVETNWKIVHKEFDPASLKNDIAIIVLPVPVHCTTFIRPIRLPSTRHSLMNFTGMNGTASGWGKTSDMSPGASEEMYNVMLTVISMAECVETYGTEYVKSTNVCVSGKAGKGTCNGDSGGPLVFKEPDGAWTLLGVVSYGSSEGCEVTAPSAFTRVPSYLGWIAIRTGIIRRE